MFRLASKVALVVLVAVGSLAMSGCSNQAEPTKPDTTNCRLAAESRRKIGIVRASRFQARFVSLMAQGVRNRRQVQSAPSM